MGAVVVVEDAHSLFASTSAASICSSAAKPDEASGEDFVVSGREGLGVEE
jgi:hypothetical protein